MLKFLQKYLRMFNPTFAPFILACITQIFAMCIAIFFGVILAYRTGDLINILLYLGTGLQYLFRQKKMSLTMLHCHTL